MLKSLSAVYPTTNVENKNLLKKLNLGKKTATVTFTYAYEKHLRSPVLDNAIV